jgi:hypothetical protein
MNLSQMISHSLDGVVAEWADKPSIQKEVLVVLYKLEKNLVWDLRDRSVCVFQV